MIEIIVIPILLIVAAAFIYGVVLFFQDAKLDILDADSSNASIQAAADAEAGLDVFNIGFIFFILALIIGIVFLAYTFRNNPAYLFAGFLVMVIVVIIAAGVSNSFEEFASSDNELQNITDRLSVVHTSTTNIPAIVLAIGVFAGIIIYGKSRYDQVQQ